MAAQIVVTFQCGHRIAITYYPNTAPQAGDVLTCYECGRRQQVTQTDLYQEPKPPTTTAAHYRAAFRARKF